MAEEVITDTHQESAADVFRDLAPESAPIAPTPRIVRPVTESGPSASREPPRPILETSEEIRELLAALVEATKQFDEIDRDMTAKGKSFSYKYASLREIMSAVRKPLADNGLVIINGSRPQGQSNHLSLTTRTTLYHTSGQWIRNDLPVGIMGGDPQSIGTGITYCRRYNTLSLLNLSPGDDEDDDGARNSPPPVNETEPAAVKPAERKSQQAQASSGAKSPIGKVARTEKRGDTWFVALNTGFVASTKNEEWFQTLTRHQQSGAVVELVATTPQNPKHAPTITEIILQR